jgi:hypothetical protein
MRPGTTQHGLDSYPPGYMLLTVQHSRRSPMCSPAPCRSCGNVTWSGCGQHKDQVLASVPESRRCTCR